MSCVKDRFNPLIIYINTLIENLNADCIPEEIDLVLDGGAFNGGYQLGILIYLNQLEKNKHINICKISGCSVGAIFGVLYIANRLDKGVEYYEKLLNHYSCNSNLTELSNVIKEFVNNYVDDVTIFNDKLYITYYDLENVQQKIVSTYKNKEELIEAMIKSSYLPYIIDGNLQYKECCDGFLPYIFPENKREILYICLHPFQKIKNMLCVKNENNVWPRVLTGIVDINNFLSNLKSEFCSYRNKWSLRETYFFRIKEFIVLLIILFINVLKKILENIPSGIKNNIYIERILVILKSLYKDIFRHIIIN